MKELKELKKQFVDQAVRHGKGTLDGDSKIANQAHGELMNTLKNLHVIDKNFESLTPMLEHENISVRTWAATYLLPYKTGDALVTLKEAAKKKGLVAFSAGITAREWEKGSLKPLSTLG